MALEQPTEFNPYLDFWVEGQKQGFAGSLPRIRLPNGSKMVALYEHPLLYVDNWYGSDLGGGQTMLYVLSGPWAQDNPLQISGIPVARLGYSGRIIRRLYNSDRVEVRKVLPQKGLPENLADSDIVWAILKSALSQVSRGRPFRGPERYLWHDSPEVIYESKDTQWGENMTNAVGEERIAVNRHVVFLGNYDFVLIKKNLEDTIVPYKG